MAKRSGRNTRATQTTGRILRPDAIVLSDAALVPRHVVVKPPPNQFTHEVARAQPYYYGEPGGAPDGEFEAGAQVVLMRYEGGQYCRVVDARGLYVTTAYDALTALQRRRV